MLFEFKVHMAEYLEGLGHTDLRTLADLIAFNRAHREAEMRFYGQELFELAEATGGDLTDPEYLAAWRTNRSFGRSVIDGALAQGYRAVLTPSSSLGTSSAATAGYPSISVPVGQTAAGRPVGLWMAAGSCRSRRCSAWPTRPSSCWPRAGRRRCSGVRRREPPDAGVRAAPARDGAVARGSLPCARAPEATASRQPSRALRECPSRRPRARAGASSRCRSRSAGRPRPVGRSAPLLLHVPP